MFALLFSDISFNTPKHLLRNAADCRPDGCRRFQGIPVEDAHEIVRAEIAFRGKTAATENCIGGTDGDSASEGNPCFAFIIPIQERIGKDVGNVPLIGFPRFIRKHRCRHFDLLRQVLTVIQTIFLYEHLPDAIFHAFIELPEIDATRTWPSASVRNVEHIAQARTVAAAVNERDAFASAPDIAAHLVLPKVVVRAGRRVRPLGVDHDLFMVRILVEPADRPQKRRPGLVGAGDLLRRLLRHLRIEFKFSGHSIDSSFHMLWVYLPCKKPPWTKISRPNKKVGYVSRLGLKTALLFDIIILSDIGRGLVQIRICEDIA